MTYVGLSGVLGWRGRLRSPSLRLGLTALSVAVVITAAAVAPATAHSPHSGKIRAKNGSCVVALRQPVARFRSGSVTMIGKGRVVRGCRNRTVTVLLCFDSPPRYSCFNGFSYIGKFERNRRVYSIGESYNCSDTPVRLRTGISIHKDRFRNIHVHDERKFAVC